jgi:hypothetical protein
MRRLGQQTLRRRFPALPGPAAAGLAAVATALISLSKNSPGEGTGPIWPVISEQIM